MGKTSKTSQDKADLESLLYGSPQPDQTTGISPKIKESNPNDIPEEAEPQPIFEFDYDSEMAELKKQARKTIITMANHILTKDVATDDYIKDKIEQDVTALAELMWARRSNEMIKLSIMNIISKGNTTPRLFDVYASMCDRIAENNKQILATEDNLRKTYLDLKYEVQRKRDEEGGITGKVIEDTINPIPIDTPIQHQQIQQFTGTKDMINSIKAMKKKSYENAKLIE